MPGQPLKRAHEIIADQMREDISPPTPIRSEPVEYSLDLIPEMIEMGRRGWTPAEIATHWAISLERLRAWVSDHPEFADAMARARTAAQAWWERAARMALATKDNRFPAGAWAMVMRGRYPEYRDKLEVNANVDLTQLVVIHRHHPDGPRPASALIEAQASPDEPPALVEISRTHSTVDRPN